jgi:HEPN domain-containing protein
MKPETAEWITKAEGDFRVAGNTMRTRTRRREVLDAVCYHCQQCGEIYLKARLVEASVGFPLTHDLERLLKLVLPVEPLWSALQPAAAFLTNCAVVFRYPGQTASERDARTAMKHCKAIRTEARHSLGLK